MYKAKKTGIKVRFRTFFNIGSNRKLGTWLNPICTCTLIFIGWCNNRLWFSWVDLMTLFNYDFSQKLQSYLNPNNVSKWNGIGGVMVSVLVSTAVDRLFKLRSGQTKDYEIGICWFSAKHERVKTGWLRIKIMCTSETTCLPVS